MRKDMRPGRVFVDWSQNDQHKTTVAPYSLRIRALPTVSTPVSWDEVEDALDTREPDRLTFETADVLERVQTLGDLYAPNLELVQSLPELPGRGS
jgi:bifunctional non-homologous end joining protein LigD